MRVKLSRARFHALCALHVHFSIFEHTMNIPILPNNIFKVYLYFDLLTLFYFLKCHLMYHPCLYICANMYLGIKLKPYTDIMYVIFQGLQSATKNRLFLDSLQIPCIVDSDSKGRNSDSGFSADYFQC